MQMKFEELSMLPEGGEELARLAHCSAGGASAPPEDYNLQADRICARFGIPVGLSDHTVDDTAAYCEF